MHGFDYEVSATELEAFSCDGALPLRSVVDDDLLGRLQAAAERARDRPGGFWYNIYLWRDDPDFRACCLDSPIPGIAARLLNAPKVNLLYDQLFIKPPKGGPTPWHHDLPYWPIEGDSVVSLWLALSEVTSSNGGLEFIRGSHRWGRQIRTFSVDYADGRYIDPVATTDSEPVPDFEAERDNYDVLRWDLNPGDAVAFHALTLHHAPGNRDTKSARAGYSLRFMGDDVRYKETVGMNRRVFNPNLRDGDSMDSEQYPVAFPHAESG
jgi:ectoine hydroxylase-related dioxygenase (phytanoyl-CoA dioxygenase family)